MEIKPPWRFLGSLLFAGGDVFAVANWIRGQGILMWDYIGWPEYVAAMFLCSGGLIALNCAWLNGLRPSVRLRGMSEEIQAAMASATRGYTSPSPAVSADRATLARKLNGMGIGTPNLGYEPNWPDYLAEMLLHARFGDIKAARALGKKFNQVMDGAKGSGGGE